MMQRELWCVLLIELRLPFSLLEKRRCIEWKFEAFKMPEQLEPLCSCTSTLTRAQHCSVEKSWIMLGGKKGKVWLIYKYTHHCSNCPEKHWNEASAAYCLSSALQHNLQRQTGWLYV